jgi:glycosyltransferase involved in cell wall biosynthesis
MTMQRAGYEALILGRPLVASESAVLREYFTDGAVFCRHEVDDMRRAFLEVVARQAELSSAMTRLRAEKQQDFNAGLATIREAIAH